MTLRKAIVTIATAAAAIVVLVGVLLGVVILRDQHYWPFSTGTHVVALWGATFEMSVPEVSRATGLSLVTVAPRDEENTLSFLWGFQYADPDLERLTTRRYAYPVTLFATPGALSFEFFDGRLVGLDGSFHPYGKDDRAAFVTKLKGALTTRFGSPEKDQEGESTSEANWKRDGVTAWTWVPHEAKKSVNFSINYQAVQQRFEAKRRERDSGAFGQ